MEKTVDVVRYIASKKGYSAKDIQRILYLSYGTYLALYNEEYSSKMDKLTPGKFVATSFGPANAMAHKYLKYVEEKYGDTKKYLLGKKVRLQNKKNEKFLDLMIRSYGELNSLYLRELSKDEAWNEAIIDKENGRRAFIKDKTILHKFSEDYNPKMLKNPDYIDTTKKFCDEENYDSDNLKEEVDDSLQTTIMQIESILAEKENRKDLEEVNLKQKPSKKTKEKVKTKFFSRTKKL